MEELDTPTPEFLKGFNQGYTISQQKPELAAELAKSFDDTELGNGFKAGRKEFVLEQLKVKDGNWRENANKDNKENELGKEVRKDEPDKE